MTSLRDLLSKRGRLNFEKDRLDARYKELVTERDTRLAIEKRRNDIKAINEEIVRLTHNEPSKGKDPRSVQGEGGPAIAAGQRPSDQVGKPEDQDVREGGVQGSEDA